MITPVISLDEIRGLVGRSESLFLEFKDARYSGRLDAIAKHTSAMANARGGRIIIGIEEQHVGKQRMSIAETLTPVANAQRAAEQISAYLAQTVRPTLPACSVYSVPADDTGTTGFVVIDVSESLHGHQSSDGRFYRRHSFGVEPLDERELRELLLAAQRADLDLVLLHVEKLEKLEPAAVVGAQEVTLGVRNAGGTAELYYRVTFRIENSGGDPTIYAPDGNYDNENPPTRIGKSLIFTASPRYAAFPGSTVPVLRLVLHSGKWSASARIWWTIAGATTREKAGVLAFAGS